MSKDTLIVMVKTKPISKDAVPWACHGSGPSSVSSSLIENSVSLPLRTASIAAASDVKWNGISVTTASTLRKPETLKPCTP
jgi:hypothetical protein